MSNRLEKDLRRIESISGSVYRFESRSAAFPEIREIDPTRLNLNLAADFLKFLKALERRENKSLKFLAKIPRERMTKLKKTHQAYQRLFHLLEQN